MRRRRRSPARPPRQSRPRVEAEVGDTDPLQAIEDALRTFPADELIVATPPADDAGWLEEATAKEMFGRFELPVTHLVVETG
ncbi:MAG: hypothetical protein ACRDMY_05315 [Gaiellaceae bacterium]